ncbi:RNA-guided endonuclease InsQ/TnpB family protein [Pectinatus frisingensis]|uniref:RNA-guided endonuclease InsQ/TnpB family protein n=1 Tax=Pectinatus frisingensis TaxID=865 RepID=UPI0018C5C68F|nr:RNA-guided endonuclease TnpB family protein [Pectinatus frisingensis]
MQITVQAKLLPTKKQIVLLNATTKEYICSANAAVAEYVAAGKNLKYSSKNIPADLPGALRGQIAQDIRSIFQKYTKTVKVNAKKATEKQRTVKVSIFKKPVAIWNNQNFKVQGNEISFPVRLSGKSKRISIKTALTDYQTNLLRNKLGTLRITQKSGKYIAQIAVQIQEAEAVGTQIIGIDLGLKIPAVAVSQSGKVRFFGNGRQNKEQRWMKDQDHKISRQIVNFAKENHASVIRLEKLSGIRQTARISRKNEKNLHSWSFYRLAQYIKYKAKLAGIAVVYVNPKYTSQTCPVCGKRNKANRW